MKNQSAILLFPLAMVIYEFAAYLSTDLIQPGVISIFTQLNGDPSLAPASISVYMTGGAAFQWLFGPLSDRIGRRPVLLTGAMIFTFASFAMLFVTTPAHYLILRFIQGTSICFIATVGYVSIQENFGETRAIKLIALMSSIALLAPIMGPLVGAGLLMVITWKAIFALLGGLTLIAWAMLLYRMPETIHYDGQPIKVASIFSDFKKTFSHPLIWTGSLIIACCNVPLMTWIAVSPVILMKDGGMTAGHFAWTQAPIFMGLIIANLIVVKFVADPTSPRFLARAVPLQLAGLVILIVGNIALPHVWLWSVGGLCVYALGIGLIFPTMFRFTLFSTDLPKGTVSATLNIIVLFICAITIEIARWLYTDGGGRLAFHLLSVLSGGMIILLLPRLLRLRAAVIGQMPEADARQ